MSSQQAYTAAQAAAFDHFTTEQLGVDVRQLMEVAGLRSAELARAMFGDGAHVTVLAGPGGNGGDALVCAKWLKLWGFKPVVLLSHHVDRLKPVTRHQLNIWKQYGGAVADSPPEQTDGIIDGLLGYSLEGDPRGRAAELIEWTNSQNCPVLALDVPSGLDATSGEPQNACIKANATIVFGVMKQGLLAPKVQEYVGKCHLIDIGFPREFPSETSSAVE